MKNWLAETLIKAKETIWDDGTCLPADINDDDSISTTEYRNQQTKNVLKCVYKCLIFYPDIIISSQRLPQKRIPGKHLWFNPLFISKQTWLDSYFKQHNEVMGSLVKDKEHIV